MTNHAWPEFMLHDDISGDYWPHLFTVFPDFQFVLCDDDDDILAACNSIPLVWDQTPEGLPERGWQGALIEGFALHESGGQPNTLCALAAVVSPDHRGKRISQHGIQAMRQLAVQHGLMNGLIAPVRPSHKARYPLISTSDYMQWTTAEGLPFDPWLRVHARLGAEILKVASLSMTITSTVIDWETWTGMRFPQTGTYVVPEALVPVEIDRENDQGRYVEPNVWMHHKGSM